MKLGLVARADNSGLGMQTWEFYRHIHPDKTMVIDISAFNNNKNYPDRYDQATYITGFPTDQDWEQFFQGLDVVFTAESGYTQNFYHIARRMGVKTAVQYNYEFMDWLVNPDFPRPDMLVAPSQWHYQDVQSWCEVNNVKHIYLHCPVDRTKLPLRTIKKARTFLHVAGKAAAHDRNGTETVIKAAELLKTQAKIVIHFQGNQGLAHQATHKYEDYLKQYLEQSSRNITLRKQEYDNYQDIYAEGDVMILPRRYGGNCLPMNEALSVGMPVIMPAISPNSVFLPKNWLTPASKVGSFTPRTTIDIYQVSPQALATKIDEFYNMNENQMWFENLKANELAKIIDWQVLAPKYREELQKLCA